MTREIIAFSILIGFPVIVILFAMVLIWYESIDNSTKIKFSSFKKFYEVNPYRWNLFDDGVSCRRDDTCATISTHFGFIDFYRYKLWRKGLDKRDREKEYAKNMSIIIANVKKDIENTERVAAQKLKEAKDILTTRN